MVSYPQLTPQQQKLLPELKQPAIALPVLFEDSTHQLWRCDTVDGVKILKVCNEQHIKKSLFWQGMNKLFNANFPDNLRQIASTYQQIATTSPLEIPEYIAAETNHFVFATWLEGETVKPEKVSDKMVVQLAEHLGQCHQQTQANWGQFHQPSFSVEQWPTRLYEAIKTLAENHLYMIPEDILNTVLQQAKSVDVERFVPIMPDLRWDQFLHDKGELSALVDLDAFVYGPRELELILVEHLLDKQQLIIFKKQYQRYRNIPDLRTMRQPYQVLLFLMNVLGEEDLTKWLNSTLGKEIDLI